MSTSSESSTCSAEYAVPPLDVSPERPPHQTSAANPFYDSPRKSAGSGGGATAEKALEKSGYLAKLGGRIKTWRRRYFVLKNGSLSYWKSQHDCHRKPQGVVVLDEECRVSRTADVGSNTFEVVASSPKGGGRKTYYLTADSAPLAEEWVRTLQNVVQRKALRLLLSREDQRPTLSGWLAKVKHGHAKRVWCVLIGKMFIYFKGPNDHVRRRNETFSSTK